MKEDFLHYVWQYKKFDFSNLTTVAGESLSIIHSGHFLQQAGPDFFNAQVVIGNQKWAGTIEIHVKSSDWYLHQHEQDDTYNNVILHVVWEYDIPIYRKDNSVIPTLVLRNYVDTKELEMYQSLATPKSWIYCENQFPDLDELIIRNWLERLFFERLEAKATPIEALLTETGNDWEAVLFYCLTKNFGLNTNGDIFLKSVKSIPFAVIRKECFEVENLEALLLGALHLIPESVEDTYGQDLQRRWNYLKHKYQLQQPELEPVQFFKHRPDNFPTIRLAQLAMLYHQHPQLFATITKGQTKSDFYAIFDLGVSSYWETHYHFDNSSPTKKKRLSKPFIDLLIINTIVPFQFTFAKSRGKEMLESLLQLLESIRPETNIVIEKFANFGISAKNAFESQSLLQLKNSYCSQAKCLQCAIGIHLLKKHY